jgi:single-stranded-DNA-specific exonuclease
MRWQISTDTLPTNWQQLQETLLSNRGITDKQAFFSPIHPSQIDPTTIGIDGNQLQKAITRIHQAKQNQDKVIIFGDYDADGISATAVLWQTLHTFGCKVMPFIPDRQSHGYGLSRAGLDEILTQGKPDLIITVDNGIVAFEALAYAQAAGVEVIVTDHHSPEKSSQDGVALPPALAVVHTTQLCGTTVAWMLSQALVNSITDQTEQDAVNQVVQAGLDLAGIATIADQV